MFICFIRILRPCKSMRVLAWSYRAFVVTSMEHMLVCCVRHSAMDCVFSESTEGNSHHKTYKTHVTGSAALRRCCKCYSEMGAKTAVMKTQYQMSEWSTLRDAQRQCGVNSSVRSIDVELFHLRIARSVSQCPPPDEVRLTPVQ